MSGMRELIDTELDAVSGGHHGCHGHHGHHGHLEHQGNQGNQGTPGLFDFGNIVAQANNATQVGVALGGTSGITGGNAGNASVAQLLGQANVSSIS